MPVIGILAVGDTADGRLYWVPQSRHVISISIGISNKQGSVNADCSIIERREGPQGVLTLGLVLCCLLDRVRFPFPLPLTRRSPKNYSKVR